MVVAPCSALPGGKAIVDRELTLQQAGLVGEVHKFGQAVQVQLSHQVGAMYIDGLYRQIEQFGYLPVTMTMHNQKQYLAFPGGEFGKLPYPVHEWCGGR